MTSFLRCFASYLPRIVRVAHAQHEDSEYDYWSLKNCSLRAQKIQNFVGQHLSQREWEEYCIHIPEQMHKLQIRLGYAMFGKPQFEISVDANCKFGYTVEQEKSINEMKIKLSKLMLERPIRVQHLIRINFVFINNFCETKPGKQGFENTRVLIKTLGVNVNYIEPTGRTYRNFDNVSDWNELKKGYILYPTNGTYRMRNNEA